jgi:acyl-CoA reductase-like NAD-dependent aldehyde dehydrogenase
MKIVNPANGELITQLNENSIDEIQQKFKLAKSAQINWADTSIQIRVKAIKKFQELLIKNAKVLGSEMSLETGKPKSEAIGEVNGAAGKCEFFIQEAQQVLEKELVHDDGSTKEYLDYDPLGVIANISAWNYPYLVGVNIFVPALIAGNAVMYKPSEFASTVGISIHKLLLEAGIPENVFQLVLGDANAGKALTQLPLDGYYFTGSYATGKKIAIAVADKLVPVGLELGGKDPLYIADDVPDIASAAANAAEGAFYNNGQSCCSVERIYVHENIFEEFTKEFVSVVANYKVGDPSHPDTQMGAITRGAHLKFLTEQVENAVSLGAELKTGGKVITGPGNFFEPTVLTNVNHKMDIMTEETFGPVIGLMKVAGDDEAIAFMNDTKYGLTSAIFTSNQKRGEALLKKINSGTGYLNCCDRVSGYLPWGGRGDSGLGASLSKHGLYTFCNLKGYHIRA